MARWDIPKARRLGRLAGKPVHRFTVRIIQSGLDRQYWRHEAEVQVIARSAADAADLVRDEIAHLVERPTEIATRGPEGGTVERFIGWESLVWARFAHDEGHQLELLP